MKNRKLSACYKGPYTIIEQIGQINFKIKPDDTKLKEQTVHQNRLKRFYEETHKQQQNELQNNAGKEQESPLLSGSSDDDEDSDEDVEIHETTQHSTSGQINEQRANGSLASLKANNKPNVTNDRDDSSIQNNDTITDNNRLNFENRNYVDSSSDSDPDDPSYIPTRTMNTTSQRRKLPERRRRLPAYYDGFELNAIEISNTQTEVRQLPKGHRLQINKWMMLVLSILPSVQQLHG